MKSPKQSPPSYHPQCSHLSSIPSIAFPNLPQIIHLQSLMLQFRLLSPFSLASNFAILGLKPSVPLTDVKRKYYELAKLYHPDVNAHDATAHKKFTEITKAYRYITENYEQERASFRTGSAAKEETTENTHGTASKFRNQKRQKARMEEQQYEDFHEYDDFFKNSKKFRKPKLGEDIYLNLSVSLQESVMGIEKELAFSRYEPCPQCVSKAFSACFSCGGKTEIYDRVRREKVRCQACSGRGFKNECRGCMGASYIVKEVKQKVYIQKGTQDKTILKVQHRGHSGFKADNGHLYVTISVEEDGRFRVDGNNVYSQLQVDFVTAACGGKVRVETVHGVKEIGIDAGTQSGSQFRLFNAGLRSPYSKRLGDHVIKIRIKIPPKLTEKQKGLMRKLMQAQQEGGLA